MTGERRSDTSPIPKRCTKACFASVARAFPHGTECFWSVPSSQRPPSLMANLGNNRASRSLIEGNTLARYLQGPLRKSTLQFDVPFFTASKQGSDRGLGCLGCCGLVSWVVFRRTLLVYQPCGFTNILAQPHIASLLRVSRGFGGNESTKDKHSSRPCPTNASAESLTRTS